MVTQPSLLTRSAGCNPAKETVIIFFLRAVRLLCSRQFRVRRTSQFCYGRGGDGGKEEGRNRQRKKQIERINERSKKGKVDKEGKNERSKEK